LQLTALVVSTLLLGTLALFTKRVRTLVHCLFKQRSSAPKGVSKGRMRTCDSAYYKNGKPRAAPLTNDERMDQYLQARAVDPAYARKSGLRAADAATVKLMKLYPALDGIVIPYFDPLTRQRLDMLRVRFFEPPLVKGRLQRFTQPKDMMEVYCDPQVDWKPIFKSAKDPLWITEGEVKALAAILAGFNTIAIGGVNNYGGPELTALLRQIKWEGRDVYLVYDSDLTTNKRVELARDKLARILQEFEAIVRAVTIPPWGADGAKLGLDDFLKLFGAAAFQALCAATPIFGVEPEYKPALETMKEVTAMNVNWLWKDYLPIGTIAALSGDPGGGKTFVALAIAADLSRGKQPATVPAVPCDHINTLYVSNENDPATVTKPRFVAMNGDPNRLITLKDAVTLKDIGKIEKAIEVSQAKLVIFDPLQSFLGEGVDMHRSNETRPVLDALIGLAERLQVCILFIRHLAKSSGGRAVHKALGSVDITGAVRTELMVGSTAEDPNNKALIPMKSNYGKFPPPLAFSIESVSPIIDGVTIQTAKLKWNGISSLTLADLTGPETKKTKSKLEQAAEFIREKLKDGPMLQSELVEAADGLFKERMLQEAAADIVHVTKTRQGEGGPVVWSLPPAPKYASAGSQQPLDKESEDSAKSHS
jgi:DNA repair protein RadA/Sms